LTACELEDGAIAMAEPTTERYELIGQYVDPAEAERVRAYVQASGITAIVQAPRDAAFKMYELQVAADAAERARQIVTQFAAGTPLAETVDRLPAPTDAPDPELPEVELQLRRAFYFSLLGWLLPGLPVVHLYALWLYFDSFLADPATWLRSWRSYPGRGVGTGQCRPGRGDPVVALD
jgi:hypothetical protein